MTVDEALDVVASKAAGRARYEGAGPWLDEVLAGEVRRLRAEVARLSEPDMFWDAAALDTQHASIRDAVDQYPLCQIAEVWRAHRLPSVWVVHVFDDETTHTVQFDAPEAAEAWLEARQKDTTP